MGKEIRIGTKLELGQLLDKVTFWHSLEIFLMKEYKGIYRAFEDKWYEEQGEL